jgi:hypothetical protein
VLSSLAATGLAAPVAALYPSEKRQLLSDLSPDVVGLLNSLGLVGLSPPVGNIVNTLSDDLKKRQLLSDLSPDGVGLLN